MSKTLPLFFTIVLLGCWVSNAVLADTVGLWHFDGDGIDSMGSESVFTYKPDAGFSVSTKKVGAQSFFANNETSGSTPGSIALKGMLLY